MKVIIAGGGTGGHLFPAVALGEEMMRERPGTEVLFVGTSAGLEAKWLPKSGYKYELFDMHGIRGHNVVERARVRAAVLLRQVRRPEPRLFHLRLDLCAELAGLLSFAAVKNNDRVGALFITDRLERYVPPRKGFDHALTIVREAAERSGGMRVLGPPPFKRSETSKAVPANP